MKVKFCHKCGHYRRAGGHYMCAALGVLDVVDGSEVLYGAGAMRNRSGECGPEAGLFVQKKPWWKFWSKS